MKKPDRGALIALPIVILIGFGVALAGSQGSVLLGGLPLFALAVALIYLVQWLAFIPAYLLQTEKFFDLTGSLTYISVTLLALLLNPQAGPRAVLLAVMVLLWAARLGTFLFNRIHKAGKDDRFDAIKPSFLRFLNTWTLQALWVTFTLSAALAAISAGARQALDWVAALGFVLWVFGFGFEVVADAQKARFRANPANRGRFIRTGLWARSRHPNYFGEIILWVGVAVAALPALRGWQWVTLISPIFVTLLLTRVSGVPMLERKADAKWGGQEEYEAYKRETPVLIPRF